MYLEPVVSPSSDEYEPCTSNTLPDPDYSIIPDSKLSGSSISISIEPSLVTKLELPNFNDIIAPSDVSVRPFNSTLWRELSFDMPDTNLRD